MKKQRENKSHILTSAGRNTFLWLILISGLLLCLSGNSFLRGQTNTEKKEREAFLKGDTKSVTPSQTSAAVPSLSDDSFLTPSGDNTQTPDVSTNILTSDIAAGNITDYSGGNSIPVEAGPNDIVLHDTVVQLPRGEGSEAVICANGQGLLVALGILVTDAEGNPVLDENGKEQYKPLVRGIPVKKGEVLGKQKDNELIQQRIIAEQQLLVAQKEVEKTLEVEVAQAACTVAEYAYKRADVLNQQIPGATPQEEMQEKLYEWIRAKKSIEQAEFNLDVKREVVKVREAELSAAQVEIEDRRFVSPIDGFIDDIMQNEGQWLREGDTILKIVRFDKMQLFGKIDARYYTPEMINGKTITVYLKKPGNTQIQTTEGKIVYVRQIVESGYFYFYAEVQNQCNESGYWLLNPGSIVTVVIRR